MHDEEEIPLELLEECDGRHFISRSRDSKFYILLVQGKEDGHGGEENTFWRDFATREEAIAYLLGVEDALSAPDFNLRPVTKEEFAEVKCKSFIYQKEENA